MNPLRKMLDRMHRSPARTDSASVEDGLSTKCAASGHQAAGASALALATDKRRLERLLRDHGMTRQRAANVVHEYFRKADQ